MSAVRTTEHNTEIHWAENFLKESLDEDQFPHIHTVCGLFITIQPIQGEPRSILCIIKMERLISLIKSINR